MKKLSNNNRFWFILLILVLSGSFWGVFQYRSSREVITINLSEEPTQSEESATVNKISNETQTINSQPDNNSKLPESVAPALTPVQTTPAPSVAPTTQTTQQIPRQTKIKVPFMVQAPYANWDALHEDACEEASLIMVRHYLNGTSVKSDQNGDKEIKDLVEFETKNNYGLSITLSQLSQVANSYYGLKGGRVETSVTVDKIKSEVAHGRPVIIPAAGKLLYNPNFKNGGPNYHMLVIIGYRDNEFITNDPGTRKGEDYVYKSSVVMNAIHDWDESNITNGRKAYLVFD